MGAALGNQNEHMEQYICLPILIYKYSPDGIYLSTLGGRPDRQHDQISLFYFIYTIFSNWQERMN